MTKYNINMQFTLIVKYDIIPTCCIQKHFYFW